MDINNINLTKDIIPEFLKNSDLYDTICSINQDTEDFLFPIDKKYFKEKSEINSLKQLTELLQVLRYWMVREPPFTIYDFVKKNNELNYDEILETFYDFFVIDEIKILIKNRENCVHDIEYEDYSKDQIIWKYIIEDAIKKDYINILRYYTFCLDNELENIESVISFDEEDFMYIAVKYDSIKCLKFIIDMADDIEDYLYDVCAKYGSINCLEFIHNNVDGLEADLSEFSQICAENGSLNCLKFSFENNFNWDEKTTYEAARKGRLDCLEFAHKNECELSEMVIFASAVNGHLDCLKYSFDYKFPGFSNEVYDYIYQRTALNGHLDCLKYLEEKNISNSNELDNPSGENSCVNAIKNNHIDCFKFLHEKGWPSKPEVCQLAIEKGNLELIKYLYENNITWDSYKNEYFCTYAIEAPYEEDKKLEILEYLYSVGCKGDSGSCEASIIFKCINCLKFLYEKKNCKWDDKIYYYAIQNSDISYSKYLFENGLNFKKDICKDIAYYGNLDFIKYFHQNGFELTDTLNVSLEGGHLDCVKYLHENGEELPKRIPQFLAYGKNKNHQDCLKYLKDNGCKL